MKNTILITGASSGIGEACALAFARQSSNLILVARRLEKLKELQGQIRATYSQCDVHIFALDVTDQNALAKFFKDHHALLKTVNVLVNNAGLAKGTEPVQKSSLADWDLMIDTNVKALFHLTSMMLPHLIENSRGKTCHIVNLGSVAGRWVYPGGAVYCATKAAVKSFSEGLRMDLMGTGIRVTNIEPGMVETEFSIVRTGSAEQAEKIYQNMTPLKSEDIAETIIWCVSRPAHVNIQELVIYPTDQAHVGMVHRRSK